MSHRSKKYERTASTAAWRDGSPSMPAYRCRSPNTWFRRSDAIVQLRVPSPKGLGNAFTQIWASVLREPRPRPKPPCAAQLEAKRPHRPKAGFFSSLFLDGGVRRFLARFGVHELQLVDNGLEIRHPERLQPRFSTARNRTAPVDPPGANHRRALAARAPSKPRPSLPDDSLAGVEEAEPMTAAARVGRCGPGPIPPCRRPSSRTPRQNPARSWSFNGASFISYGA